MISEPDAVAPDWIARSLSSCPEYDYAHILHLPYGVSNSSPGSETPLVNYLHDTKRHIIGQCSSRSVQLSLF